MQDEQRLDVLVVDDTPIMRLSMSRALESANINVVEALSSGEEAIAYLQEHKVDALLIDLRMPGLGGVETSRQLRRMHPQLRIVMLSAYADQSLIDQSLAAGVDAYVIKGAPLVEILSALRVRT